MSLLLNGDCLEHMKSLDDDSIDLVFCDLPYGQTSCKWDCLIDLDEFWKQIMRIKKLNTPIFFTCTTKFGVSLINSAPKKIPFRYDIIWVKSAPTGFLCAKKMPMRKHEMIYVFYEKLPFYDLSTHKHKFIKEVATKRSGKDNVDNKGMIKNRSKSGMEKINKYDPPLPVSVIKEEKNDKEDEREMKEINTLYNGKMKRPIGKTREPTYDPPLPVSVVKEPEPEPEPEENMNIIDGDTYNTKERKKPITREPPNKYDPPLPVSVVKEEIIEPNEDYDKREKKTRNTIKKEENYGKGYLDKKVNYRKYDAKLGGKGAESHLYDPPLPTSIIKQNEYNHNEEQIYNADYLENKVDFKGRKGGSMFEPPLPTTMLEIKSTKGKHSTEKPVALMEWIFKYYSKEGDVVLDPTMGSGSTGVACKNMKRNFIGIEKDAEIYEVAVNRIED